MCAESHTKISRLIILAANYSNCRVPNYYTRQNDTCVRKGRNTILNTLIATLKNLFFHFSNMKHPFFPNFELYCCSESVVDY